MAGLVFGKGVCTFISGNSSVLFYWKEGVGLRVTDGIRKDFEDVSLDMVTVLFWVQELFPNLMEWDEAVCGNIIITVCNCSSYSCQLCSPCGVKYTSTIRFNQTRVARAGVVDTYHNNLTALLDMAANIRTGPEFPVSNFERESRFGMMGKGGHFT